MEVIFFDNGVEIFLSRLQKPTIAKALRTIDLLEQFGNQLGMPHSKYLGNNLFELRIRGKENVRFTYAFRHNKAIILHGFIKKTQKTPSREMAKSQNKLSSLDNI